MFPSPASSTYWKDRGVRYLVVHERHYLRRGFDDDMRTLDADTRFTRRTLFVDAAHKRTLVWRILGRTVHLTRRIAR